MRRLELRRPAGFGWKGKLVAKMKLDLCNTLGSFGDKMVGTCLAVNTE